MIVFLNLPIIKIIIIVLIVKVKFYLKIIYVFNIVIKIIKILLKKNVNNVKMEIVMI